MYINFGCRSYLHLFRYNDRNVARHRRRDPAPFFEIVWESQIHFGLKVFGYLSANSFLKFVGAKWKLANHQGKEILCAARCILLNNSQSDIYFETDGNLKMF